MITIEKLKEFSKTLDDVNIQVKDLIHVRTQKHLFDNVNDFDNSLIAVKYCPQDYYNFRLFDFQTNLHFNRHTKKFYFFIETTRSNFYSIYSFTDFIKKNKISYDMVSDYNFILAEDTIFDEAVKLFYELVRIVISFYLGEEKLFIYL